MWSVSLAFADGPNVMTSRLHKSGLGGERRPPPACGATGVGFVSLGQAAQLRPLTSAHVPVAVYSVVFRVRAEVSSFWHRVYINWASR